MRECPEYVFEGERLLSVTEVLSLAGLSGIAGMDHVPRAVIENAARRGSRVHEYTQLMDEGLVDELPDVGDEIYPYVSAYQSFREDTDFEITGVEVLFRHLGLQFVGRVDRVGTLNGNRCVIDIKNTASKPKASVGFQLAGYEMGVCPPLTAPADRYALWLKKNGKYKLIPYEDPYDYEMFQAALAVAKYKYSQGETPS